MTSNKKSSLLLIYEVLKEYSDKDHYLTQQDIIDYIQRDYDITLERKSVSKNIQLLEDELHYDIDRIPKKGCCLLSRTFDESQVQYLIDAIFSSKNITGKQANELAELLRESLSKYQRKKYGYLTKSVNVNRNTDSDFFLNIEIINDAIEQNKQISFQYIDYDEKGNEIIKWAGWKYKVSPYYMINNFGKYYLLCNYNKKGNKISNYRIDYMRNIEILDENRISINTLDDVPNYGFNIDEYVNDHIYLFGGEIITAKVQILNSSVNSYIVDWFGKNAQFQTENDKTYVYIHSEKNALYYWCLQYCENIKVIEPDDLVEKIKDNYKKMNERYNNK